MFIIIIIIIIIIVALIAAQFLLTVSVDSFPVSPP